MGIKGLWQLLEPNGRPISLESMENKIIAVDISIWLNQAVKGFRDPYGGPVHNAHLIGLFHRLCKLLFCRIRPIFVFDGGVPLLKKQTQANRQHARQEAKEKAEASSHKLLAQKLLQFQTKSSHLNKKGPSPSPSPSKLRKKRNNEQTEELFKLPPMAVDLDEMLDKREQQDKGKIFVEDINKIDVNSPDFQSLPADIKHEILSALREKSKKWSKIEDLPQDSNEFATFQIKRLLGKRTLQQKLEETEKEMNDIKTFDMYSQYDDLDSYSAVSKRIISEDDGHLIFIKKTSKPPHQPNKVQENVNDESPFSSKKRTNYFSDSEDDLMEEVPPINSYGKPDSTFLDEAYFEKILENSSLRDDELIENKYKDAGGFLNEEPSQEISSNASTTFTKSDPFYQFIPENMINAQSSKSKLSSFNIDKSLLPPPSDHSPLKYEEAKKTSASHTFLDKEGTDLVEKKENPLAETNKDDHSHHTLFKSQDTSELSQDKVIIQSNQLSSTKNETIPRSSEDSTRSDVISDISGNFKISGNKFLTKESEVSTAKETPMMKELKLDSTSDTIDLPSSPKASTSSAMPDVVASTLSTSPDVVLFNEAEERELQQFQGLQERLAASISDQMYKECQELLRLFGVPYIVSPMEAEAQCAYLDATDQTHGTITEDSDIWVFGGKRVYKNFFTQGRYVEFFKDTEIFSKLGLTRSKLVNLAMLCGGDYTEGIEGIGPITGMEVLSEFPGDGMEPLLKFKSWWEAAQTDSTTPVTNTRAKLRKFKIPSSFPNPAVFLAYMEPEVDTSRDPFSWGRPDLDQLREFTRNKFGWSQDKVDQLLLPIMKKLNDKQSQSRLDSFFSVQLHKQEKLFPSKRLQSALQKLHSSPTKSTSLKPVSPSSSRDQQPNSTNSISHKASDKTSKPARILKNKRKRTTQRAPRQKKNSSAFLQKTIVTKILPKRDKPKPSYIETNSSDGESSSSS